MSAHPWDEWLAAHRPAPSAAPVLVHLDDAEHYVWVHPCGCMTDVHEGAPMYPVCREHGDRAVFIGQRGDGYVTTGGGRTVTTAEAFRTGRNPKDSS